MQKKLKIAGVALPFLLAGSLTTNYLLREKKQSQI